jgi:hypothetical protein
MYSGNCAFRQALGPALGVLAEVLIAVVEVPPHVVVRDVEAAVEVTKHHKRDALLGPRLDPAFEDRDLPLEPAPRVGLK